jgi:hypothetical protein
MCCCNFKNLEWRQRARQPRCDRSVFDRLHPDAVELFRKEANPKLIEEDDTIFTASCMTQFLYHDLILIENQVPWMVLETLFNLTILDSNSNEPLILLATGFLNDSFSSYEMPPLVQCNKDIKHFVDLFRKFSTLSTEEKKERIL